MTVAAPQFQLTVALYRYFNFLVNSCFINNLFLTLQKFVVNMKNSIYNIITPITWSYLTVFHFFVLFNK